MDDQQVGALLFTAEWNKELLRQMEANPQLSAPELLRECAGYHYRSMNTEQLLEPFIGNLEGFIEFLSKEWGWIIT